MHDGMRSQRASAFKHGIYIAGPYPYVGLYPATTGACALPLSAGLKVLGAGCAWGVKFARQRGAVRAGHLSVSRQVLSSGRCALGWSVRLAGTICDVSCV